MEWTCSTGSLRAAVTRAQTPLWYGWQVDQDAPVSWPSSLKMAPSLSMAQLHPPLTLTVCASLFSSPSNNLYTLLVCSLPLHSLLLSSGWNSFANLLYIDQPAGTGFSYVTSPFGYVTNEREIATEIWDLIREFYALYPQYSKLDLYIVGESYGEWNLAVNYH